MYFNRLRIGGNYTDRFKEVKDILDDFVNIGASVKWVSMPSGGVMCTFEYGKIKLDIFAPEDVTVETIRTFATHLKSFKESNSSKIISFTDGTTIRHLQAKRKFKT